MAVYRPLVHKVLSGKGWGIAGLESPLVDRDAEFCALEEAIDRLRVGVGGIATIVGEAGIWLDMLRGLLGVAPDVPPVAVHDVLDRSLRQRIPLHGVDDVPITKVMNAFLFSLTASKILWYNKVNIRLSLYTSQRRKAINFLSSCRRMRKPSAALLAGSSWWR